MKDGQRSFLQNIEALFDGGVIGEQTDRQLLQLFADRDPMAAELAFTVLVRRHGPMVFRACRAILRDPHAAEDAFQATFLVLARKAGGLWVRGSLGPWLLSVARRVAYCARTDASRQRAHERTAAERAAPATVDPGWDDRDAILHEELVRLPEKYRTAVVLCDLEGLTQEQAARQLGWPDGTVRSRLARGRERLRERLTRRGMAPAVVLAGQRPLIDLMSVALVQSTVQGALRHVPGQALGSMAAAGVVPAAVATLAEKGMRTMLFARSKTLAWALVLLGGGTAGVLAFAQRQKEPAKPDAPKAQAVAGAPSPRQGRALLEARIETAREIINRELDLFGIDPSAGPNMGDRIPAWSRRMMEDRLRLADTPGARLDAIREHRNRMISLERQIRRSTEAGATIQPAEAFKVKYYRLEADQLLAEAGVDPAKEPPVAENK
jgi:RNA polymerase sigma factor (sigma-70 family)